MNVGQVEFSIRVDGIDQVLEKLRQVESVANGLDGKRIQAGLKGVAKGTDAMSKGFTDANEKMSDYQSLLDRRTRQIAQWGSRMQTLGNSMQRISSPFFSVFKGAAMGIGYKMLGKFMNSISGAVERYDTMRTYENVLNEIGINASQKFAVGTDKARTAIDNLEQSVLGLPTGLDEMVASMRTYAGITNDVEKATKMAIAANNAFIAGGMDETRTRMAERQLQNLLSNGELTAQQWNSLQKNMPLAFNAVGKALGYTKKNMASFLSDLKSGKVAANDFVDAFIKVGTEGSVQRAAQKMKMTWNAVSQNIQNAFNRMGANILDTLDNVFEKATGRDFLQTVLGVDKNGKAVGGGIKDFIDGISESIQGFIKSNPDKIMGFFDRLKSIDWKGILQGYGDVAKFYAGFIGGLMKTFGGRNFIVAMAGVNLMGKFVSTIGSLGRGLARPLARLSLALGGFAGSGKLAKVVQGIAGLKTAGEAAKGMTITWQGVANKALNIGAILAVAGSIKIVASAMKDIASLDIDWGKFGKTAAQMGIAVVEFGGLAAALGALTSSNAVGWITAGSMAIGSAEILAISGTIYTMAKAMNEVAKAEVPDQAKITALLSSLEKIGQGFKSKNPIESIGKMFDAWSKGAQADAIKKITGAFDNIAKLGKVKLPDGVKDQALRNFENINEFAEAMYGMFETTERDTTGKSMNTYGSKASGIRSYDTLKKQAGNYAEMIMGLSDAFKNMESLITNMKTLQEKFSTLTADSQTSPLDFSFVRDTIGDIAEAIYSFASPSEGNAYSPFQMIEKAVNQLKGADISSITQAFKQIPALMSQMQTVYNEILNNPMFGSEKPQNLEVSAAWGFGNKNAIEKSPLNQLEDTIVSMFGAIDRIRQAMPEDASTFAESTGMIRTAVDTIRDIVLKVQTLSTEGANTAGAIDLSGIDIIGEKIGVFITKIGTALNTLNGLGGVGAVAINAGALNTAVDGIKSAIGKLTNLNFDNIQLNSLDGVVDRVKQAIAKLKQLDGQSVSISITVSASVIESASGAINTAADNINTAWKRIKPIYNKTVSISIKAGNVFNSVPGVINAQAQRIRNAVARIPSSITKTVSVNIVGAGSNILPGLPGNGFHTGGLVGGQKPLYRAFGGFAFKPKGTDTVPAFLTPGEYVVRRKAVDTFGARFLQRINHLDVKGALNALSIKAGQRILPSTNTVINNKTTNNYNNVNLGGITNNNPHGEVGLTKAGRMIHALQH